jgi:hypothetical protein
MKSAAAILSLALASSAGVCGERKSAKSHDGLWDFPDVILEREHIMM